MLSARKLGVDHGRSRDVAEVPDERSGFVDQTWGRRVRLPEGFAGRVGGFARGGRSGCRAIDAMTVAQPLSAWQALGVRRVDGSDLPRRDLPASLVRADGGEGGDYLVYKNYHAVLRYNCAHHYGLTVGTLADRIGFR